MTTSKNRSGVATVIATLIGPAIPGAYMAITGHAPTWARIWYGVWFVLSVLLIIAKSGRNDGR